MTTRRAMPDIDTGTVRHPPTTSNENIMRAFFLSAGLALLAGCGDTSGPGTANTSSGAAAVPMPASHEADVHFLLAVDGRNIPISNDDVLVTSQPDGSLRIFAGPDDGTGVVLTIPDIAACPCSVPAGSSDAGHLLNQGSVSLQNHPEPGVTLNSWYLGRSGTPASDAITVTDIGTLRAGVRFIAGKVHATALANAGDGQRDTVVDADFRVRHEPRGGAF